MNQTIEAAQPSPPQLDPVGFLIRHPLLVAAIGLTLFAFGHPFYSMYIRWTAPESYYSHGFLIPLVSLWLVWRDRKRLATLPIGSWTPGLVLVCLGALSYLFGEYQGSAFPSYVALMLLILGGVGYLFGTTILKATLFPILFLAFMLPIPETIIGKLTYSMKYLATGTAVKIVQATGEVCQQRGSEILFVHQGVVVPLQVGDVCSGLRSMIALLAMGALYGFVSNHPWPLKLALFILSIPIAFISNVARIYILCVVAYSTGNVSQAMHDNTGYLIYAIALALLFAVDVVFSRFSRGAPRPEATS